MKLFFDTEFTGLHQNTTLISIGIISENGMCFYAEFTDYDKDQVDPWIQENVIANLYGVSTTDDEIKNADTMFIVGDTEFVKESLLEWLDDLEDTKYSLISDVSHYDMVLFANIFGGAQTMPKSICPYCHDINQDIANSSYATDEIAFDTNRENVVLNNGGTLPEGKKHNSLFDAKVIRSIYEIMQTQTYIEI